MKLITVITTLFLLLSCNNIPGSNSSVSDAYRSNMRLLIGTVKDSFALGETDRFAVINNGLDIIYQSASDSSVNLYFTRNTLDGVIQTRIYGSGFNVNTDYRDSIYSLMGVIDSSIYSNFVGSIEISNVTATIDSFFIWNNYNGYKTFVTNSHQYRTIPDENHKGLDSINSDNITSLSDVKNFLIYSDFSASFDSANGTNSLIRNLEYSNHDLIVVRPEVTRYNFNKNNSTSQISMLNAYEIETLKTKENGSRRLVFCELNVSKAQKDRLYWKEDWTFNRPNWMSGSGTNGYDVDIAYREWSDALLESSYPNISYIRQIRNAGFDGIYFTGVDIFHNFESTTQSGILISSK